MPSSTALERVEANKDIVADAQPLGHATWLRMGDAMHLLLLNFQDRQV